MKMTIPKCFRLMIVLFRRQSRRESYNDVSISDTLMSEQRSEVETLIQQYSEVLSSLPGCTDQIQHDIKLLTSEPIRSKSYPIPFKTRYVMEAEIQEMVDLDVTEPSISSYSSPVVLVPKKDGSVRFGIDFRKVNEVTEFDAEPMPNMEEVIIKMSGHNFFMKMDLSEGYWQFSLSERSKPFTAFETPRGWF